MDEFKLVLPNAMIGRLQLLPRKMKKNIEYLAPDASLRVVEQSYGPSDIATILGQSPKEKVQSQEPNPWHWMREQG